MDWYAERRLKEEEILRFLKGENMKNAQKILVEMNVIEEEIPLEYINSDDARYHWPKRWKRLREFVGKLYEPPNKE